MMCSGVELMCSGLKLMNFHDVVDDDPEVIEQCAQAVGDKCKVQE